jgi:iron complex outermembrane receptor protein
MRQTSAERSNQFTQELRFVSNPTGALSFGGKLDFLGGLFYYHDSSFHTDTFAFGADSIQYAATRSRQSDNTIGNYDTSSYAAFGQGTWHITNKTDLTAGVRYTRDDKKADLSGTATVRGLPLIAADFSTPGLKNTFSATNPRATLAYKPVDTVNLYASFSQGFKSGGFQYTPYSAAQAALIFQPETLNAYEIGAKSALLDHKVTLDIAIYQYNYKNIQVSQVVSAGGFANSTLITNAATSQIRGAEMDLSARPIESLLLEAAYAYTDAKYLSYVFNGTLNYSGTRMVRAPKHSLNLSAQYDMAIAGDVGLTLRSDYALLSEFFHEPGEGRAIYGNTIPFTREGGYGLANGRATLHYRNFRLSAYCNNMFDRQYRRSVVALPGQLIGYYGAPRTFGVTLNWKL